LEESSVIPYLNKKPDGGIRKEKKRVKGVGAFGRKALSERLIRREMGAEARRCQQGNVEIH